jgi:hypothetical protein
LLASAFGFRNTHIDSAALERSVLAEGGVVLRYGQFYGATPITSSDNPKNLGFTSTELPNERWSAEGASGRRALAGRTTWRVENCLRRAEAAPWVVLPTAQAGITC